MSELAEKIPAIETEAMLCERLGCRTEAKMFVKRGVERRAFCVCHAMESIGTGGKFDGPVIAVGTEDEIAETPEPVEVVGDKSYSPTSPYGQVAIALAIPKPKRHQLAAV
jgi:hypothetical protein